MAFRHLLLLLTLVSGSPLLLAAAPPRPTPWSDFQIIIWQTKTERQYRALKAVGVTAAMLQPDRDGETPQSAGEKVSPIIKAGLRPYLENIATDFYSAYHRWFPDKPVNAAFLAVQKTIAGNPGDQSAFIRRPSLSDAHELLRIKNRITEFVRTFAPYRPLFFDLGDETGIADLSAAWDFDFSPGSLSGMREWLKQEYGTLAALNREWDTHFAQWEDVVPPTTTETMMRTDGNYAAWSDFKSWMDLAFARAIGEGARAVHAGAPWALAAIEGAQMPGWGGYDYSQLAPAVDVMELYEAGQNLELAQAFNPHLTTLMTVRWAQPDALHRSWREFLRGVRGMVIWDPDDRMVNPDGSLGPDGETAAPFFAEVNKPPAALIMASRPVRHPIAVLYSPQSYRLQWLLDHRAMGGAWTQLGADDQNADNAVRTARRRVVELLDQLAVMPHFVSAKQINEGQLTREHDKIVVLPQTLAVSNQTADALRAFVHAGGTLIAEGQTGVFDGHGRSLSQHQLSDLLNGRNPRAFSLSSENSTAVSQLAEALRAAKIVPEVQIASPSKTGSSEIEHYHYRNGSLSILALLARPSANTDGATARVSLVKPEYIYDVRTKLFLGHARQISISTGSRIPAILAMSLNPLSAETCKSLLHWDTCPAEQ